MKKYIIKMAAFAMFASFLSSCEADKIIYSGADFVTFPNIRTTALPVTESSGTLSTPVNLSKAYNTDVTVTFEITPTNAVAGVDYEILTPTVVIPAGELSANFSVRVINDDEVNGVRTIDVKIASTSVPGIEIGLAEEGSYFKKISIVNDDCPTKFTNWLGNLSIEDVGESTYTGTGESNASGACDVLVVTGNLAGETSTNITGGVSKFNILFTPTNDDGSVGEVVVPLTSVGTRASGGTTYDTKYSGSGTYDVTTGEIVIDYTFDAYNQSTGAAVGTFWTGQNIIKVN